MKFYPSMFSNIPIPYRKAGTIFSNSVKNGGRLVLITPTGVPYGLYGRLALIAITTLAYRSNDNLSVSSESLYSILKQLKNEKPTGNQLEKFESQMISWANTTIHASHISNTYKEYKNLLLIEKSGFTLKKNLTDKSTDILFTKQGKEFLTNNTIPLPIDVLKDIEQPLSFDIFTWAVISLFSMKENKQFIQWEKLYSQFNISPNKHYDFRHRFNEIMKSMLLQYYPQANIVIDKSRLGGVYLVSSQLLVSNQLTALHYPCLSDKGDNGNVL